MPARKHYVITRTQTVEVTSTNPHDALKAAEEFFDEKSLYSDLGTIHGQSLKLRELSAKEL